MEAIRKKKKGKAAKVMLLATLIILACFALAGCGNSQEETGKSEVIELVNIAQIEEELDIKVALPASIEKPECSVTKDALGKIKFKINGKEYSCLVASADEEKNLFEQHVDSNKILPVVETGLHNSITYTIKSEAGGTAVMYWYDAKNKVAYTLYSEEKKAAEALKEVGKTILDVQQKSEN